MYGILISFLYVCNSKSNEMQEGDKMQACDFICEDDGNAKTICEDANCGNDNTICETQIATMQFKINLNYHFAPK